MAIVALRLKPAEEVDLAGEQGLVGGGLRENSLYQRPVGENDTVMGLKK